LTQSMRRPCLAVLCLLALAPAALPAQPRRPHGDRAAPPPPAAATATATAGAPPAEKPKVEETLSTSHHTTRIGGGEVRYTADAGTFVLKEEDGTSRASIFYVAYTRDGVQDLGRRPVVFAFNGGPGSSSVWLHMGLFGPRRVVLDDRPVVPPPPYALTDNAESILDVADLVFIDPVTTGYSRQAPGEDPQRFHGVRSDMESVAEFIRLYATRHGRWTSPKYLAGESYGTTRAAALARYLQERHGMYLNGLVLISSILNFETSEFAPGNDLPFALYLPTYTAIAWYHQRLPADLQGLGLQKALEESERYAAGDYTLALMQGSALPPERRREVAARLSRYTGLAPEYLERADLRLDLRGFVRELLRDRRLIVGRLDGRFTGVDRGGSGDGTDFDPSYAAIQGPFSAALNDYVRGELGYKSDLPYEILTDRVHPWSYEEYQNQYVNVAEDLRRAMAQNPALRVFVANGYFDLATPFYATHYTFDHLGYEPTYRERVSMDFFAAGHMVYILGSARERLKQDVARFLSAPAGGTP
jgi:carboxypeptidase C (cathepsin A)